MELSEKLESMNESTNLECWAGTFKNYLKLFETGKYPNLGVLSHQRILKMIESAGVEEEDHFGTKRKKYKFFEDCLYGIEETVDNLMSFIKAAAQRSETAKRMLLLWGPVSTGKSQVLILLKRGLEQYSRTDEGAVFALSGCKMHENPLHLIPHSVRDEFREKYNIVIEGELCPYCKWRLDNEFNGKFMNFPVERIYISEALRKGIGTFLPTDTKCLTANCFILTENGIACGSEFFSSALDENNSITKIHNGKDNFVSLKNCYDNGIKPVYNVKMRGISIEATANHRFMTIDEDGNFEMVPVRDILGKIVPINIGRNVYGDQGKLTIPEDSVYNNRHKDVHLPESLSPALSRMVGYLASEGYCSDTMIEFCNNDSDLKEDFCNILKTEFKLNSNILSRSVIVSRQKFIDFINCNFNLNTNACDKKIPLPILRSSKRCQVEFLEGLYLGDGSTIVRDTTASILLGSCSLQLVREVQAILINMGVFSTISSHINKKYPDNRQYRLASEGYDAINLSKLLPQFMSNRNVKFDSDNNVAQSEHYNYESFGSLRGLLGEIKKYTSINYLNMDGRYLSESQHKRSPRRNSLKKILDFIKSDECKWEDASNKKRGIIDRLENLLNYRCVPVISVENTGMQHVFDIEVDHPDHVFYASGLISHNSQDQSELTGGIDFSRIQDFGSDADPRAFNFDGELNVSNRGILEMVEALKSDERFLRVLLTATQEKRIKAPKFGLIYLDSFIILHSNETEFVNFIHEKKYEAYHDRMFEIKSPYILSIKNEIKLYDKLLKESDFLESTKISPKTLEAAAMLAVLTRIEPPSVEGGDLTLVKKMKLYDQQDVKGFKMEQVPDIKKKSSREGLSGISPRFMIDQINTSISKAHDEGRDYITALDVLHQLNKAIRSRDLFDKETKNRYDSLINTAREEWNEMLRNDIQKAFFISFDDEARALCENYLDHIEAAQSGTKPRDRITEEEIEVDTKLMENVESHIDVTESGREDFRNEILRAVGSAARKGREFDYIEHAHLREAIQKQLFTERKGVIRMTVSSRNPEPEALKRLNEVIERMCEQQGYTPASANELLKYASAHLFDKS